MNFESISDEDGIMLVQMARSVVTEYITNNNKISEHNFKEKFSINAGVKKLSDALTNAAISASTDDPRFPSIKQDELNDLVFEVTVLSDTKEISTNSPDEIINSIKIGRDGLIIEKDFESGLLLPQVPIEYNWNVEDFLKHTCHKAGLPSESWKDKTTKISKFQGLIFREVLPNGEIIREKFQ